MRPQIRLANTSDTSFIADCNIRMALETEQRQLDQNIVAAGVSALLNDANKGVYFIAQSVGKPVGQMLITYEWSDWRNGTFWWIQSVYIVESFRCQGIFRALFEHVSALARAQRDVCGLRLYVETENTHAKQVYSQLGMRKTDYELFETDFVFKH
jgi:GNAT superfamily N-acetyltransferase